MNTCAVRALLDEKKLLWFISNTEWHVNMHTIRDTLHLQLGISFVEEVIESNRNNHIVFLSLVYLFRLLFLALAHEQERRGLETAIVQN